MARKFRSAESYLGNTAEARKRQRLNLIPGNRYQKMRTKELRLNCWWEVLPLGNAQDIYENYQNKRDIKDVPKSELKDDEFLNKWWEEELTIENKEFIIKCMKGTWRKEDEETQKKEMYKCLKEKLALLEKAKKQG